MRRMFVSSSRIYVQSPGLRRNERKSFVVVIDIISLIKKWLSGSYPDFPDVKNTFKKKENHETT
jgi:hypothetical protein